MVTTCLAESNAVRKDSKENGSAGGYVVVAARRPSDVAMPAPAPGDKNPVQIGNFLIEGDKLQWIDGKKFGEWAKMEGTTSTMTNDPMFADVYYGLKLKQEPRFEYTAGGKSVGWVHVVDSRIRLVPAPAGSPVYILEKPLSEKEAKGLEAKLKDMKFDPGPVDGVIDHKTRTALGFYLEYKGLKHRFKTPCISAKLLEEILGRSAAK